MILPDYISSNWLKDSFDSWVQRCRSASCAKSFETLMEVPCSNLLQLFFPYFVLLVLLYFTPNTVVTITDM